jgi:hypothetical protein
MPNRIELVTLYKPLLEERQLSSLWMNHIEVRFSYDARRKDVSAYVTLCVLTKRPSMKCDLTGPHRAVRTGKLADMPRFNQKKFDGEVIRLTESLDDPSSATSELVKIVLDTTGLTTRADVPWSATPDLTNAPRD